MSTIALIIEIDASLRKFLLPVAQIMLKLAHALQTLCIPGGYVCTCTCMLCLHVQLNVDQECFTSQQTQLHAYGLLKAYLQESVAPRPHSQRTMPLDSSLDTASFRRQQQTVGPLNGA